MEIVKYFNFDAALREPARSKFPPQATGEVDSVVPSFFSKTAVRLRTSESCMLLLMRSSILAGESVMSRLFLRSL